MVKKPKPPTDKKNRRNWDRTVNWKRTWSKRLNEREIIPEFVQNWRRIILSAYKKSGLKAAEKQHTEFTQFFRDAVKEKHLSPEEAKGAIENLDSFLNALRKMNRKP